MVVQLLNQGAGYGVLVGVGGFFAIGIVIATRLMGKYLHENSQSTEMFMVANRTVGVGLTASAVYSSWTWATELLWCSTMVYLYGVQASYWYGAGLAVQICVMGLLGIEAKKKIPTGHTCLEIVELRYGRSGHVLYMFLCLVNNLLSSSSMILGAAGAISAICSDLHIVAATMLIPFGVLLYTAVGGLKSTFLTDYIHSLVVLIVLCYICTKALVSEHLGGIDGIYNLIREKELAGTATYIAGNYQGSYLTGKSQGAIYFGIIHAVGDFGLTVMDSSFWQKSFSADVRASVPGYLLAAFTIFANVWPLGTIVGLGNVIIEDNPIFPTYPDKMSSYEINSGLGLVYTTKALMGNGGLGALLLIIYLAVTSTVSAQMISVSSIISFDIYRKYFKPHATDKQLINVSHAGVVFFGLFSAGFSVMLHYVGVDMTWLGYFYSMLICPGVIPMILLITWDGQTKLAFIISPIVGMLSGLAIWLVTAWKLYGSVTILTTGQQLPCMYGGLTTLLLPGILSVVISLLKPSKFDWGKLNAESQLIVDEKSLEISSEIVEAASKEKVFDEEKGEAVDESREIDNLLYEGRGITYTQEEVRLIDLYRKIVLGASIFVLIITWVVWPLPLYRDWIWSIEYFRGWTVMGLVWVYMALIIIGLFPLWDGRHSLAKIFRGILGKRAIE
ncbi:uncharacterized protein PRCAT00003540001 [Priceomyces carsonii]|uniref:uncharacterized protein n=1 Tax=Priceomyces carsonii TaxID=28549 RepID=UPI002ED9A50F|nr:unnamed protein product [Priceomyces carsonii]